MERAPPCATWGALCPALPGRWEDEMEIAKH